MTRQEPNIDEEVKALLRVFEQLELPPHLLGLARRLGTALKLRMGEGSRDE